MTHETDGVGHRDVTTGRRPDFAHRRIEGGEQRVVHQHTRSRQPVQQAGLPGVGVTGEGDHRNTRTATSVSLGRSGALHSAQLRSDLGHVRPDPTTIRLDLRFAWSTRSHTTGGSTSATARLPRQRLTPSPQTGQQVLHLRQTDLRLTFSTARMLSEDVQDEPRSVDNFDLHDVLKSPQLTGAQFTVTDDRVRAAATHEIA